MDKQGLFKQVLKIATQPYPEPVSLPWPFNVFGFAFKDLSFSGAFDRINLDRPMEDYQNPFSVRSLLDNTTSCLSAAMSISLLEEDIQWIVPLQPPESGGHLAPGRYVLLSKELVKKAAQKLRSIAFERGRPNASLGQRLDDARLDWSDWLSEQLCQDLNQLCPTIVPVTRNKKTGECTLAHLLPEEVFGGLQQFVDLVQEATEFARR